MNFRQLRGVFFKAGKMQFPEQKNLVRQLGADSMVLLKNSDLLPINRGKIALFGAGAVDTVCCGIYYNYVYTDKNVSIKEGLLENGFTFTTDSWLEKMEKSLKQEEKVLKNQAEDKLFSGRRAYVEEVPISVADMAEAILGTDTCIYVIRRQATYEDIGSLEYQLTEEEHENIKLISGSFKNVILVLNSGMIELSSVARMKNVKAIILMGIPGMEAGNSLADVLTGIVNPSGRLTSTWAKKYKDYSTCYNATKRKDTSKEIDYKEGIYVGYRYFDAFDVAPLYPFGYGLSYTNFRIDARYFEASWMGGVVIRVKVTNTGDVSGRQVVQLYCSQPEDKLDKPYQILVGFGKTGKLKPGESEEITMKIPIMQLCSFDEENSQWIMEKGDYLFRIGDNSRNTTLCAKLVLDKRTVYKRVTEVISPKKNLEFLTPPPRTLEKTGYIFSTSLSGDDFNSENKVVVPTKSFTTLVPEGSNYVSYVNSNPYEIPYRAEEKIEYVKPCGTTTFFDVIKEKITMEEFVSSLSPEILARIVSGELNESKLQNENRFGFDFRFDRNKLEVAARTTSQFATTLGIPGVTIADGPSGLHLKGVYCTCYPSPMNMAQTWDMGAMVRMGRAYGREMEHFGIDYCLAPALNIVRNPMKCIAYELYSEDPSLSGIMGAGFIMGVKRYEGRNVIIKNLPTINQENFRRDVNINVSSRAFGEIYLRSFSVCQFTGQPAGVLSSTNSINGEPACSQRGLNTDIIRNDWGFKGFVMSDWGSDTEKSYDLHAGCDLIMPGYNPDKILESMMETAPTFEEDGYVSVVETAYLYDIPMIRYENWGSFMLDKDGKDKVVAKVPADIEISEKALKAEKEGLCKIETEMDGTKTITYFGIDRGAYFALGELQQAVIHILSAIKDSAAMKKLMEHVKI